MTNLASHTLEIQTYLVFRFIIILLITKNITKNITKIITKVVFFLNKLAKIFRKLVC